MEDSLPQLINHWVLQTIAVALTALLIPKLRVTSIFGALGMATAISFVNATVWNATLFSSMPLDFSSRAFGVFVANGVLFWLLVKLLPGIESEGVLPCLLGPIVFTILSVLTFEYGKDIEWIAVGNMIVEWVRQLRDMFMGDEPKESVKAIGLMAKIFV